MSCRFNRQEYSPTNPQTNHTNNSTKQHKTPGRGLVHAYWAPNAYSFYCLADLALGFVGRRLRLLPPRVGGKASWASGLVQVVQPEALPEV